MKTAVRQLTFLPETGAPEYIDLAECLSQVNRQAYSQGYVYLVESFSWEQGQGSSCLIASLPTSWTVYQSWKKAKRLWDKMNRLTGVAYPAYHDYKVFFEIAHYVGHSNAAGATNLQPVDGDDVEFSHTGREWRYSQYVTPQAGGSADPGENCAHMLGDDTGVNNVSLDTDGSYGVIQGYGDTRTTVGLREPELPGDASVSWQTELFDTGETMPEMINHLELFNDQPPYAHALDAQGGDNPIYVGGSESGEHGHRLAKLASIAAETVYAPGGEIPLGLLRVETTLQEGQTAVLTVNLAPGVYQGIAAMPMGKVST